MSLIDVETVVAESDEIELVQVSIFGYQAFHTKCAKCMWRSKNYDDRASAIIIGSLHECEPEDGEVVE